MTPFRRTGGLAWLAVAGAALLITPVRVFDGDDIGAVHAKLIGREGRRHHAGYGKDPDS